MRCKFIKIRRNVLLTLAVAIVLLGLTEGVVELGKSIGDDFTGKPYAPVEATIVSYLHHRYGGRFAIRSIIYDGPQSGQYEISAYPIGEPNTVINLTALHNIGSKGIVSKSITDNYDVTLWAEDLNGSLTASMEHIYGSDTGRLLQVEGFYPRTIPYLPFKKAVTRFPNDIVPCVYLIVPFNNEIEPDKNESLRFFSLVELLRQNLSSNCHICIYFIPQDRLKTHKPPTGTDRNEFIKYMLTYGSPFYEVVVSGSSFESLHSVQECEQYIESNYQKGTGTNFLQPTVLF